MRSESNLVYELWEIMREHVPAPRRVDTAMSLIRSFIDFGFEKEDFADATEECEVLRSAYNLVFEADEDEDEEEELDF